jgi:hypothetical protein
LSIFRQIADHDNPDSLAARLRRKRYERFQSLIRSVPRPIRILDVGGTQGVWNIIGFEGRADVQITLLNLYAVETSGSNIRSVVGDARNMQQFETGAFDLVFSNSVIEHVGGPDDMKRMADEIKRVGKRYFIETPNRYFPVEPHFLFPFFQFLPFTIRTMLLQNFRLGYCRRRPERADAEQEVRSIRLLSGTELKRLSPEAVIERERLCGLTRCLLAYNI